MSNKRRKKKLQTRSSAGSFPLEADLSQLASRISEKWLGEAMNHAKTFKQKLVIIRSKKASTRDIFLGPRATGASEEARAGLTVEIDDVSRRDIPKLLRDSDVEAVAPSMPMKLIAPITPVDDGAASPSAQGVTWGLSAVGADSSPFTGDGVVVAVLDTGIDATHPAFSGVELVRKDFTNEGNTDNDGHGTHCAGTIFGRDTDNTRIGVALGVKKALIGKVLGNDGGSSDQIVSAIQWAVDQGAHVISMSLGMDFPGYVKLLIDRGLPAELATTRALQDYRANVRLFETLASLVRAQAAVSQPTIIIAAAGNESQRDIDPNFEIGVSPPAVSEGIISVAALGRNGQKFSVAPYSNTGANVSGPGTGIVSARVGGGLVSSNGTSMAAPHVAGVAALWAQKLKERGSFNSLALTARLIASATDSGLEDGFDPFDVGAGLVRAPQD